jgi:hypothetical protein
MNSDAQYIESASDLTALVATLAPGAHLLTRRQGYIHHGIYVGNGEVIHYVGFKGLLRCGPVEKTTLADFANGYGLSVETNTAARYIGVEIVRRASSRLGENDYHLLTNNCEHFCTWCLSGQGRSQQVEALMIRPWRAVQAIIGILFGTPARTAA